MKAFSRIRKKFPIFSILKLHDTRVQLLSFALGKPGSMHGTQKGLFSCVVNTTFQTVALF